MFMIDALITAGGKGTRMRDVPGEKPLVPVGGRPMVDWVIAALRSCPRVGTIHASVSDNAPLTRRHLLSHGVEVVETSGSDYVTDLGQAMRTLHAPDILICPADLPFLEGEIIGKAIVQYAREGVGSLSVGTPADLVRALGVTPSFTMDVGGREVVLCGLSVVDRTLLLQNEMVSQGYLVVDDLRLALNINSRAELEVAERRFAGRLRPPC